MNELQSSPACERASDLIAFVYNETSESEARDFELHLKQCSDCREEVASFGVVRESIVAWRDEALSGFVAQPLIAGAGKKSALAAFRQFFDLSPLWLKVASGFAVLSFCVLAALAFFNLQTKEPVLTTSKPEQPQEVLRIVKEAPDRREAPVKTPRITRKKTDLRNRRPLSRAERDQIAADLRLLSDDGLDLLSDRINQ
jgi:anti-sigma factor RsiW